MLASLGLAAAPSRTAAAAAGGAEAARIAAEAAASRIVRDDWGVPHVSGASDADAVFALIYAQAEDDYPRIEANYLTALGRTAEAEGEAGLAADLRQRLFVDPAALRRLWGRTPPWLRRLTIAWADGLNLYLERHPGEARTLKRYEPWMALAFTEGSIGGDVESVDLKPLAAFYGAASGPALARLTPARDPEPRGSNGIAIAPRDSADRRALLLINPHTSFYFRSEAQLTSGEGLNVYGASTWGQFFIYQGFNSRLGFMHTSSGVDRVDVFTETPVRAGGRLFTRYGSGLSPVSTRTISIAVREPDGRITRRRFRALFTRHGPVVAGADGRWSAVSLMNRPAEALEQSWLRGKARSWAEFRKVLELKANSSNNTIYADAEGRIAYLHPQFVPRRNPRLDYRRPVDGSDPSADWRGVHGFDELPHVVSPASGYVMNTNDAPWSAAGPDSPDRTRFPAYMDTVGENPRGIHAARLLASRRNLTLEGLRDLAFDPALPAFDDLLPALFADLDALASDDPRRTALEPGAQLLRSWDRRWSAASTATSLAVFFGEDLWERTRGEASRAGRSPYAVMAAPDAREARLASLAAAMDRLRRDFGSIETPWGEINRYQRLGPEIQARFDDRAPSIPVPFTSARWGSLASFGAKAYPNTRRIYGSSGNSFVALVEFGPRIRAVAVKVGGQSGRPASPHFRDQAERYASGDLRPVYFYPDELAGHVERSYRPGETSAPAATDPGAGRPPPGAEGD